MRIRVRQGKEQFQSRGRRGKRQGQWGGRGGADKGKGKEIGARAVGRMGAGEWIGQGSW